MSLENAIQSMWRGYRDGEYEAAGLPSREREVLDEFLAALESGDVRAAAQRRGEWHAVEWVKRGVLLTFALREIQAREFGGVTYHDVLGLRPTGDLGERGSRNTPTGSVIRRGAFVGADCIAMSPSFVNVGAHVGSGTLIDSCNTVGSCAQVGENVKLGANTLVGGVLEPIEDAPVIIEDDVTLGAGCRVTSGFIVGEGSVVGENTILSPRIPVYDLVEEEVGSGILPPGRRAFTRFVEASEADHDLFGEGGAYKPAVVATALEEDTRDAVEREGALRE